MASRTRRARVALGVIAVAVIGLGVWRGEALYWWVITKRVYVEHVKGDRDRGYRSVRRWTEGHNRDGVSRIWYVETGMLYSKAEYFNGFGPIRYTEWNLDGSVYRQVRQIDDAGNLMELGQVGKTQPPWWWGVTDQTEPTMPEGMRDDEKWAKALEEQKTR